MDITIDESGNPHAFDPDGHEYVGGTYTIEEIISRAEPIRDALARNGRYYSVRDFGSDYVWAIIRQGTEEVGHIICPKGFSTTPLTICRLSTPEGPLDMPLDMASSEILVRLPMPLDYRLLSEDERRKYLATRLTVLENASPMSGMEVMPRLPHGGA